MVSMLYTSDFSCLTTIEVGIMYDQIGKGTIIKLCTCQCESCPPHPADPRNSDGEYVYLSVSP